MSKFEVIRGVEGCCLALDDMRIAGPKPWGGGEVIHAWETDKEYKAVDGHSHWHQLFGTPERAARTWIDYCGGFLRCADCPCCHDEHGETCELPPEICAWVDEKHGYDALLEWLRGDA